eukprot:CAMPEP_0197319000 /NCGR_PEP_ID=MMETSP0891-20130614/52974_1 /TAXON_ID=44058 ORGANISM="Aureoumbra lagunensis, Strain CCMP1510" /NCGR_SAMPLE_ID=MMETSP0891 /ASSEMBLY_ACC=CAM_ASM_000534 /LENGTH=405 /DNA_ID=CAMNT_0042809691 /DNA_START=757 /DNA_END=1974 /DNA_ORIENTATION=+
MNNKIDQEANSANIYAKIAQAIAPEIHGHDDIKKSLLLQLVGGVAQTLQDGMKIRGDIHILLLGDPGVAKSQILKYMSTISPRGVYTTGKGSSGVGLTASVTRDPLTSEISLDSGALILADMGICSIDEFDKMDEYDRTAIHEVMEQQTVSIAKAGLTTTLNARCSILAAANPIFGRYSFTHSVNENLNLPHSLLSRFDLLFLLLDRPDVANDALLAHHVTYVHRYKQPPPQYETTFDMHFVRQYISQARQFEPIITPNLLGTVVDIYVDRRQEGSTFSSTLMTARQLLSILRLSQALARLRFDDQVNLVDIDESIRLTYLSQKSLQTDKFDQNEDYADSTSRAFDALRNFVAKNNTTVVGYQDAETAVTKSGIHANAFHSMVREYEDLALLYVDPAKEFIEILQ